MKFSRAFVFAIAIASSAAGAQRPLREVLYAMPKGGDLHNHLSGAVYAETFLDYASRDGDCIDTQKLEIVDCPATPVKTIVPANATATDPSLYSAMLDALSMRQFRPIEQSGHDHFFSTFVKFALVSHRHVPEMVADVVSRLAAENVDYAELMFAPDLGARDAVARRISGTTPREMYDSIMNNPDNLAALDAAVAAARKTLDDADAMLRSSLRCGTPDARPGCESTWRNLYELYRGTPRQAFFAGLLVGYRLASVDPRVVGLDPVMPEDAYAPMTQFDEQMRMFEFMHSVYPHVHLSTHAGELTLGLVPIEGLRHHIRDSVIIAGAERIGHGVDIAYERDATDLMRTMAARGVAVEICLTSNDVILGVRGRAHPLPLYLANRVPVALATDDAGVSRDDMTNQYMRAVEDQGLRYEQLKQIARNSLEYAFVEGSSLWADRRYSAMIPACASDPKSDSCASFLAKNTKARLQWRLEQRLRDFETRYADSLPR
jgi:hypothetical protein